MTIFVVPNSYVETRVAFPNSTSKSGRYPEFPGRTSWLFNITAIAAAESWTLAGSDTIRIAIPTPALGLLAVNKASDTTQADTISICPTITGTTPSGICAHAQSTSTATVNTNSVAAGVSGVCSSPITVISTVLGSSVPGSFNLHVSLYTD